MEKPVVLMEATLEQLQAIKCISNEMASKIIEVRDASEFIDLNVVFGITGVPKSELKKYLVEPGISALYQKLHSEIAEVRNELQQEISTVKAGLQEVDAKASEIENLKETVENLCIRVTKVEQTQLMGSTIQFKNPLPLLQEDPSELADQQKELASATGGTIDTLIKIKNQQAEEKFGMKPKLFSTPAVSKTKLFSTPAVSTANPDFSKVSPISKSTKTPFLDESYTANSDVQEDMYASAASTLKLNDLPGSFEQEQVKSVTISSVGQGPRSRPCLHQILSLPNPI